MSSSVLHDSVPMHGSSWYDASSSSSWGLDLSSSSASLSSSAAYVPPNPLQKRVAGNFNIADLWWDSTEVTQAEYYTLMNDRPWTAYISFMGGPSNMALPDRPAVMNYFQAVLFANARSKKEGLDTAYVWTGRDSWRVLGLHRNPTANGYRLPSEAEWSHAYDATIDDGFYWSSKSWVRNEYPITTADTLEIMANAVLDWNSRLLGRENADYGFHAVATKLPNAYGLYDMSGNIDEFIEVTSDPYVSGAIYESKGGDWGEPYMGVTGVVTLQRTIAEDGWSGLRLVRPIQ